MRRVLLLACLVSMGCKTSAPASSGRIVFTSTRNGHPQIYSVDAGGGHLARLTVSDSDDDFPLWSPDGTRISFLSNRSGNWDRSDCPNVPRNPSVAPSRRPACFF